MAECWSSDPSQRPTFTKLVQSIDTVWDRMEGQGALIPEPLTLHAWLSRVSPHSSQCMQGSSLQCVGLQQCHSHGYIQIRKVYLLFFFGCRSSVSLINADSHEDNKVTVTLTSSAVYVLFSPSIHPSFQSPFLFIPAHGHEGAGACPLWLYYRLQINQFNFHI